MSVFVKVGHFAKSTGVAPATQALSGFGWAPVAGQFGIIFWTSGGLVDGTILTQAGGDARSSYGIASGTAAAQQFAGGTSPIPAGSGSRRHTQKAILLVSNTGAVTSEASLTSLDSDGVTLTWSTNAVGEAQVIHYMAFGGTDVKAKVVNFTTPANASSTGITGAGFAPNAAIFTSVIGAGVALDTAVTGICNHIGVAVSATQRWSAARMTNQAVSSGAWRWQHSQRPIAKTSVASTLTNGEYSITSFDADGVTLFGISGSPTPCGVLFLNMPSVGIGTFVKPTGGGPAAHSVSVPFPPMGVLLASTQDVARADVAQTQGRLGVSAFTASGSESSVASVPDAANPIAYCALDKSGKAAVKIDNATPAVDAEATAVLTGPGFDLTWNANDAVATEFVFLAVGDFVPIRRVKPRVMATSTRYGRRTRGMSRRRVG